MLNVFEGTFLAGMLVAKTWPQLADAAHQYFTYTRSTSPEDFVNSMVNLFQEFQSKHP